MSNVCVLIAGDGEAGDIAVVWKTIVVDMAADGDMVTIAANGIISAVTAGDMDGISAAACATMVARSVGEVKNSLNG